MKLLIPRKSIALIVKHNGDEDVYTDGCTLGCLCGQRYSSNTIRFDEEVYYPNNVDIQLYSDDNYVTTIDTEQFIKLVYGYQASKTIEYTIESIKPEIELDDGKFVTDKRTDAYDVEPERDFASMMDEFKELTHQIQKATGAEFKTKWAPKIVEITNKYLGVGKKVNDCTAAQSEQVELILSDLKDLVALGL